MHIELDDAAIRNYLLGLLPEAEAEILEEAYLADPQVWERVRGVEDDLLDDYAGGRLAPEDRRLFERKYLASPPLRDRVVAARALHRAAASRRVVPRPAGWLLPLAAAAAVTLAVVAVWRWSPPPRDVATVASPPPAPSVLPTMEPRPEEPTPVASPTTPPPASAVRSVVLALSPVLLRGEARPAILRVPPDVETAVFELEGDPALVPRSSRPLAASVETVEGGTTWNGEAQRATVRDRPSLLAVARVPTAGLAPGDYIVTLSAGAPGAVLHRYFVRVAR